MNVCILTKTCMFKFKNAWFMSKTFRNAHQTNLLRGHLLKLTTPFENSQFLEIKSFKQVEWVSVF